MAITISLPSYLGSYTGGSTRVDIQGRTVGECLRRLTGKFPQLGKLLLSNDGTLGGYFSVYLNKKQITPGELEGPVKEGDEIYLLPLIAGG